MIKIEDPAIVRECKLKKGSKIPISLLAAIEPREAPPRGIFNFAMDGSPPPLHVIGDSSTAIGWLTGTNNFNDPYPGTRVKDINNVLYMGWANGLWRPREFWQPFCSHVYREHNKGADALATSAIEHKRTFISRNIVPEKPIRAIQCYIDGGHRDGVTGAGVIVDVSYENVVGNDVRHTKWVNVVRMSYFIGENNVSDSMVAELYGASQAILAAYSLVHTGIITIRNGEVNWRDLGLELNLFTGRSS